MSGVNLIACAVLCTVAAAPAFAETPEEQLAAASALYSAQKYSDAAQKLEAFLAAAPKHPKAGAAAFTLGRCYTELKAYPQAIVAYEKTIALKDPAVGQLAYLGLGEAAMYAKQYGKVVSALEVAVKGSLKPGQAPVAWFWLGQADYQLQRYDEAQQAYRKVVRDYGSSDVADDACFGAGLAELKLKRADEARRDFQTLIDRYPKSANRSRAVLYVAQMDLEAKRYPEARAGFESLLKDFSSTAQGKQLQADAEDGLIQTLLALKDYNAATGRLESAVARLAANDPQRPRAQLSLGHCRYRIKDYDLAYTAFQEAARSAETGVAAEGLYWAANAALAQMKYAVAAADFTKYVTRYPALPLSARAQLKAADALAGAQQAEASRSAYQAVITRYPQSAEAAEAKRALADMRDAKTRNTIQAARADVRAERYTQALTELTALLKTTPGAEIAAEAQYLLGVTHEAQKRAPQAVAAYTEALRLKPGASWEPDIQASLAWLYIDLKQPALAEKAANAALSAHRTREQEQQANLALLQALLDQNKLEAVLVQCKTLLDRGATADAVPTVLYIQAATLTRQNHADDALALWERLAAEYPKSEYAAQALLKLGEARSKGEKWEEARVFYARLVSDFPASPLAAEARFDLAGALYHQDKFAEAATAYDMLAENKTAGDLTPEALYWAGVAYTRADNKEQAIKRLTTLVEKYPKHTRVANAKTRLAALKAVKN